MGKNKHRGDSLSKRIARLELYLRVRAHMGEERFEQSRFCYLASFEGGDASVLEALGVPRSRHLAVDFDAEALRRFEEKYPGVPTFHGRVEDVPDGRAFDCMFLDFCANLSDATIASCVKASARLARRHGSVFAFALQRGREQGWKGHIEEASQRVVDASLRHAQRNGRAASQHSDPADVKARLADGRVSIIYDEVAEELTKSRVALMTLARIAYRSVNPEELARGKPGTPMIIGAYWASVAPLSRNFHGHAVAATNTNGLLLHEWNRIGISCLLQQTYEVDRRVPTSEHDRLYRLAALNGGPMLDLVGYESRANLCRAITNCADHGVDPAKALNLSSGSIAALRAHASRGTYAAKDLAERQRIARGLEAAAAALGVVRNGVVPIVVVGDPLTDIVDGIVAQMGDDPAGIAALRAVGPGDLEKELKAAAGMTPEALTRLALAVMQVAGLGDRVIRSGARNHARRYAQ